MVLQMDLDSRRRSRRACLPLFVGMWLIARLERSTVQQTTARATRRREKGGIRDLGYLQADDEHRGASFSSTSGEPNRDDAGAQPSSV